MSGTDCLFVTSSRAKAIQFSIYPYLGVGYLADLLFRESISCKLFDADLNHNSIKKLVQLIQKEKPIVVGYSVMSISLPFFYKITRIIKSLNQNIIIVAGGPHITNNPQTVAELGIDYGFTGYAEESFSVFMKKIKSDDFNFTDIKGLIIPSQNRTDSPAIIDISHSDNMPLYSLYNILQYQNIFYGAKWFTIITSRGCPYNCTFCKDPGKNRYREYPLESVKKQIQFLVNEKKLTWVSFVDDTFTFNRNRVIELCEWIIKEKINFKWTCCTRADTLDEELIKIMKSAGLHYVIIGIESGNEEIRKKINKNISNSRYNKIIHSLRQHGIRVLCSYVLGNPGETYSNIWETIKYSKRIKANYAQYYNMTALPQSPIFNYAIEQKIFEKDVWIQYMRGQNDLPYYIPQGLQLNKLKNLRIIAFINYYLKPKKFFDLGFRFIKFFAAMTIKKIKSAI